MPAKSNRAPYKKVETISSGMLPSSQKDKDPVLECFKTDGVYLRVLHRDLDDEILILDINSQILKSKKIYNANQLTLFIQKSTTSGFLFRPSTLVKEGLPIRTAYNYNGIIIDPNHPGVLATHFYKQNACSYNIASGNFVFDRTTTRLKDKKSRADLTNKLLENEARRLGFCFDNYNRNYGQVYKDHNEVLLSYTPESIIGVFVTPESAHFAITMKHTLEMKRKKPINFYFYHESGQLSIISDEQVAAWQIDPQQARDELQASRALQLSKENISSETDYSWSNHKLDITCSLEDFLPSQDHPIRYQLKHRTKPVCYSLYMHHGVPVIEHNGKKYNLDDNGIFIREIVDMYQKHVIRKCNALFKDTKVLEKLPEKILLKISKCEKSFYEKSFLELSFPSKKRDVSAIEKILENIGYPYTQCKWEVLTEEKNRIKIKLCVLQALSMMMKKLQSYTAAQQIVKPTAKAAFFQSANTDTPAESTRNRKRPRISGH